MAILYVSMGISGSGKTLLNSSLTRKENEKTCGYAVRVCMDDLRKIYTGDISNQSQNNRVFSDALVITRYLLYKKADVIFDATCTRADIRNKLLEIAKEQNAKTKLFVLNDSLDIDLCRSRVIEDIKSKIDRSNTSDDPSILERQQAQFMVALKAIDKEGWQDIVYVDKENMHLFTY